MRSGSVSHAFLNERAGERCEHVMPSGWLCGRLPGSHRKDARGGDRHRSRVGDRHKKDRRRARRPSPTTPRQRTFVFFDAEGKGGGRNHKLVYGAAATDRGDLVLEIDGPKRKGKQTQPPPEAWLNALLEVGRRTRQRSIFAYGFGYDRTKMLEGLPPEVLYKLTRREQRPPSEQDNEKPEPLWWGDYMLDLQGTRFSVAKLKRLPDGRPMRNPKTRRRLYDRITVWDVIKFFQCPFVDALDGWRRKEAKYENLDSRLEVPDAELDHMREMKAKRAEFDKLPWKKVKTYCQDECRFGAALVRELTRACEEGLGIKLRRYDGAGSISDALMRLHGVERFMSAQNVVCRWMRDSALRRRLMHAIMCAFAGGRFESAYAGILRVPVYAKDICSAYPYAMWGLPCLACGRWEHVGETARRRDGADLPRKIESAALALVRVRVKGRDRRQAYGSLFHRDADGNITFPIDGEGWCWAPEYLAARDHMKDRVEVLETFLYRTDCDHQPFRFMAELYLERLRIGKEGRGTAMKLGYNGCTGKTMQRVGSAKWQEYAWAGMVTSTTRAQLLRAIARFQDQWDVAYVATDSVFATRDVPLEEPENTGTEEARTILDSKGEGKLPLGAWEAAKPYDKGMVFLRPGIAFPLEATARQIKEIKARGVSKRVLLEHTGDVIQALSSQREIGTSVPEVLEFSRRIFGGMKMCTTKSRAGGTDVYRVQRPRYREGKIVGGYGCWYEQEIRLKIGARPKRFARLPGEDGMLLPWPDKEEAGPSRAYGDAKKSAEALALEELQDVLLEQPDLDAGDWPGESDE